MKKTLTLVCSVWLGTLFSQSSPQTYTVPGAYSFTVPAGVTSITVEVIGAGGSGGGNGTGGGGGGVYAKGVYAVTPGAVLPVKVGTPGSGAAAGTSSVSTFISASGGANGTTVSNPSVGGGGAGGTGTGGNIANYSGGTGGGGYYTYFGGGGAGAGGSVSNGTNGGNTVAYNGTNCLTPGGSAGTGGGAPAGNGGKGAGFTNSSCSATDPAASGSNFGGGGGGGNGIGSTPGTGAGGYCQISWLSCAAPSAPANNTPASNQVICASNTATLLATGSGTLNWYASASSGTSLGTGTTYVTPALAAGTYTYYAATSNTCTEGPRTAVTISVNANPVISVPNGTICSGQSFTLSPSGASSYTYSSGSPVVSPTAPTNTNVVSATYIYTITGSNAAGCRATVNSSVTVFPLPAVNASSTPSLICSGSTATLIASGANSYTWSTNASTSVVPVTPSVTTTYSVTGRSSTNGCSNAAMVTVSVSACTGIHNLSSNAMALTIYPNPGKGDFTISSESDETLLLTDNMGKIVRTIVLQANNHYKAEVNGLSNGIYYLVSEDGKQPIREKIVVAK